MSSIRDQLVNRPAVFRRRVVDVPEWGVKFEVRSLSVAAKIALGELADADADPATVMVHLATSCLFDPDSGEKVFSDADADWLRAQDSAIVEEVTTAALEVSGLVPKAIEIPKDDSSKTPSTGTSSNEPKS